MTVTVDAVVNFNVFDAALALCSVDDFWWERNSRNCGHWNIYF